MMDTSKSSADHNDYDMKLMYFTAIYSKQRLFCIFLLLSLLIVFVCEHIFMAG